MAMTTVPDCCATANRGGVPGQTEKPATAVGYGCPGRPSILLGDAQAGRRVDGWQTVGNAAGTNCGRGRVA